MKRLLMVHRVKINAILYAFNNLFTITNRLTQKKEHVATPDSLTDVRNRLTLVYW